MSREAVTEYVDTTVQEAIEYIDGEVNDKISLSEQVTLNEAKEYTDTQDAQTLSESKSYADSKSAQTLADAKEYANAGNAQALNDAKSYADAKDTQTLSKAKEYTDTRFSQFDIITIVSELPATGEPNRLYLVTKTGGTSGDLFDEYVWENGAWERVGSASVDLSGYATTEALTEGLAPKVEFVEVSGNTLPSVGEANKVYVLRKTISGGKTVEQYMYDGTWKRVSLSVYEGNSAGYRIYGVKGNGDPVLYSPNNSSAEVNSIAQRGSGGVLIVGNPTADNHATTKQYVDKKCVNVNCDFSALSWTKVGQVGPDAINDIGWTTPYSALGIKSGAKAVIWVLTNAGYPYKTGSCVFGTYPTTEESGGLIQFTNDGNLTVIGANSPSMSVSPNALFVVFY
jgi:hypothetical protein